MDRAQTSETSHANIISPEYSSGAYFSDPTRHSEDAPFKAEAFRRLFRRLDPRIVRGIRSYADVGCGSGDAVQLVARGLREDGCSLESVFGYDLDPRIRGLQKPGIEFVHGDFCASGKDVDLVTLFDVVEHVPA